MHTSFAVCSKVIRDSFVLVKFYSAPDLKIPWRGPHLFAGATPCDSETMAHAHDHTAQMAEAEKRCAEAGESFTPLRKRVLELLLKQHGPAKAYDADKSAKPPTVYRALDFLVRMGLAHRIESLNAFMACDVGACERSTIFLICEQCGGAEEFDAGHALIDLGEAAKKDGFTISRTMIEASGICAQCQQAA